MAAAGGVIPRAVLLTGPLGAGKTAVAVALGDLLAQDQVAHAVIDLDWLAWCDPLPEGAARLAVLHRHLTLVAGSYRELGFGTLVLARAVVSTDEVRAIRSAVGGALVAFRLSVPEEQWRAALTVRGDADDLAHADAIAAAQRELHLPAVRNHGRSALETAAEVRDRLGWSVRDGA